MTMQFSNKIVNNYINVMRTWDTEAKKKVIMKLTESINNSSIKHDFSDTFGKWEDEKNADEIIKEIHNNRLNNNNLVSF